MGRKKQKDDESERIPSESGVEPLRRGDGSGRGIGRRPVGTAVGAVVGGVAGGLAGKGVAEAINPKFEDEYWRESYATRNYVREGEDYETFAPAYRYGWESYSLYPRKRFDEVEPELRRGWERSEWNAGSRGTARARRRATPGSRVERAFERDDAR
jgi:hypothetical protein